MLRILKPKRTKCTIGAVYHNRLIDFHQRQDKSYHTTLYPINTKLLFCIFATQTFGIIHIQKRDASPNKNLKKLSEMCTI